MKKLFVILCGLGALTACTSRPTKTTTTSTAKDTSTPIPSDTPSAPDNEPLLGAYGGQRPLTADDAELFTALTKAFGGVRYTPLSVATQMVAGTNYCFVCRVETLAQPRETYAAKLWVFRPLPRQGEARIVQLMWY